MTKRFEDRSIVPAGKRVAPRGEMEAHLPVPKQWEDDAVPGPIESFILGLVGHHQAHPARWAGQVARAVVPKGDEARTILDDGLSAVDDPQQPWCGHFFRAR